MSVVWVLSPIRCHPPETHAPVEDRGVKGWVDVRSEGEALAALVLAVDRAMSQFSDEDEAIDDPVDLRQVLTSSLGALLTARGEGYLEEMHERGAELDRTMAIALGQEWNRWGLLESFEPDSAGDTKVFSALWTSASKRGMNLLALNLDNVSAGRGISAAMPSEAWPLGGVRSQLTLFVPPSGRLTKSAGEELDGGRRTAFVRLRVRFGNGLVGFLRVNYYVDGSTGRWFPLAISIGCDQDDEQWPFPLI